jgi:uracil phosphoribosyltransferase
MGLHVVDHPLLGDALAALRDRTTSTEGFRAAMRRAAAVLFVEASRDLPRAGGAVKTPLGDAPVRRVPSGAVTLVPILRAGLGMLEGVLPLVPGARVAHVGIRRDEETARPSEYYRNVPAAVAGTVAFVLDPMLATGGTAAKVLAALGEARVRQARVLVLVAAPEGLRSVHAAFPAAELFVAAVDDGLDPRKFILPGLGDAGDRFFGTGSDARSLDEE